MGHKSLTHNNNPPPFYLALRVIGGAYGHLPSILNNLGYPSTVPQFLQNLTD